MKYQFHTSNISIEIGQDTTLANKVIESLTIIQSTII